MQFHIYFHSFSVRWLNNVRVIVRWSVLIKCNCVRVFVFSIYSKGWKWFGEYGLLFSQYGAYQLKLVVCCYCWMRVNRIISRERNTNWAYPLKQFAIALFHYSQNQTNTNQTKSISNARIIQLSQRNVKIGCMCPIRSYSIACKSDCEWMSVSDCAVAMNDEIRMKRRAGGKFVGEFVWCEMNRWT